MHTQQEIMKHPDIFSATRADAVTRAGFALALLSGIAAMLAGFGSREGWWYFMTGFAILRDAVFVGFLAALVSLIGGIMVRHEHHPSLFVFAALGILVGLVAAGIPLAWLHAAETMPQIHDISTDTKNPPEFFAIMPLRVNAENGSDYEGSAAAAQQRVAYPDIRPIMLPVTASQAFAEALKTAESMGWQIVAADAAAGRIEAVATTFWFGFKDDIVVRVTRTAGGSRVDMRSVSRVGLSDIGTNANRVRTFLHQLADRVSLDPSYTGYSLGY